MSTGYERLAKKLVARATKLGAKQAEAFVQVGREASCRVRDGEIEHLSQSTSKGVGLRVYVKNRLGFAWTSDFEPSSLDAFVTRALQLAEAAAPNPLNGLPGEHELGAFPDVGALYDAEVASLSPDWKITAALEMEKAARAFDPKVKTVESVEAGESVGEVFLASSAGVSGYSQGTSVYLYTGAVAEAAGQLQNSWWYDARRFLADLESPEAVATEAARRAVRMLGAKKVKSQRVPVVFDPMMAASFIGGIAGAVNGDAVYKKASFLAGKLGQRIAPPSVTVVDDGLLPRGLATSPFDGEGVPTRRSPLVEQGVLKTFLYDAFTARKAKARSTGNASRGYRSLPGIGTHNLYLEPGTVTPEALVKGVSHGFYVTSMLGHGANLVTGDYSRGANGLWIENGELTRPVQEVTVAGNLLEMLSRIDGIGADLTFRGSVGAPTIRFSELTVSGE
ncbi:MAG: TldD/PmbA family protein [Myxococcaceae bacterium]|nr:TldD/PmbA family protein [Myxococcaceae bacterium]